MANWILLQALDSFSLSSFFSCNSHFLPSPLCFLSAPFQLSFSTPSAWLFSPFFPSFFSLTLSSKNFFIFFPHSLSLFFSLLIQRGIEKSWFEWDCEIKSKQTLLFALLWKLTLLQKGPFFNHNLFSSI